MSKMGRTRSHVTKRNMWTFYIPKDFFPDWERFLEFTDNDPSLDGLGKSKYKNYRISAGIRIAIKMYNNFRQSLEKRETQEKMKQKIEKTQKPNLDKITPIKV